MALHFLSGDAEMNGKKKNETKPKGGASKPKKKKVAKVALAPARASFLTVTELNLLNTGKKLARVWNAKGGKDRLIKWWTGIGGDPNKLKKAISKGSKQTISGTQMGVIGTVAISTATALLIAVAPIIKEFKAGGDDKEKSDFDSGVAQGIKDLDSNPDVTKEDQDMPEGADVALVKPKKGGDKVFGLHTNPISISFFLLMMIFGLQLTNPILVAISTPFALYALIGFIIIPFSEFGIAGEKFKAISRKYFDVPAQWFFSLINFFSHGKA
jgi:hypothetical protein